MVSIIIPLTIKIQLYTVYEGFFYFFWYFVNWRSLSTKNRVPEYNTAELRQTTWFYFEKHPTPFIFYCTRIRVREGVASKIPRTCLFGTEGCTIIFLFKTLRLPYYIIVIITPVRILLASARFVCGWRQVAWPKREITCEDDDGAHVTMYVQILVWWSSNKVTTRSFRTDPFIGPTSPRITDFTRVNLKTRLIFHIVLCDVICASLNAFQRNRF